jgi:hypothetical protein
MWTNRRISPTSVISLDRKRISTESASICPGFLYILHLHLYIYPKIRWPSAAKGTRPTVGEVAVCGGRFWPFCPDLHLASTWAPRWSLHMASRPPPGLRLASGPSPGLHLGSTWSPNLHLASTWPPPGIHLVSRPPPDLFYSKITCVFLEGHFSLQPEVRRQDKSRSRYV